MEGGGRDNQRSGVNRGLLEAWAWTASADQHPSRGDENSAESLGDGKTFCFCFDAGRNSLRNDRRVYCL